MRELQALAKDGGEPATAELAVERILAWRSALTAISAVAEAQILACCAAIRREHPERDEFRAFVSRRLSGSMDPDRAWLMADTWAAARKNRQLRELVARAPAEAIEFVRGMADALSDEEIEALDEDDARVTEILAAAPRSRRKRIRALLESDRAARDGRHPDDVRRIEDLERRAAPAPGGEFEAALSVRRLADALSEHERALAETVDGIVAHAAKSGPQHDRLLRLGDLIVGQIDRLSDALRD